MRNVKDKIDATRVGVRQKTPYLNVFWLMKMPVRGPEFEVHMHLRDLDSSVIFPEDYRLIKENWWPLP